MAVAVAMVVTVAMAETVKLHGMLQRTGGSRGRVVNKGFGDMVQRVSGTVVERKEHLATDR